MPRREFDEEDGDVRPTMSTNSTPYDDEYDEEGASSNTGHIHMGNRALPSQSMKYLKYSVIGIAILLIGIAMLAMIIFLFRTKPKTTPTLETKLFVGENGAVAADIPECSEVGVSILRDKKGNAMDAAVATCLCIGVIGSYSSGIGGGAIMLVSRDSTVETLDFREKAPMNAHRDMFNNLPKVASERGGQSIAVPGEIKGLYTAWQKYGSLPWKDLVQPAIKFARDGYKVSRIIASKISQYEAEIVNGTYGPGMTEVYAPQGKILKEGDVVKNTMLARTLEVIAEGGEAAFYNPNSQLVKDIISDIQKAGGIINATDLEQYNIKIAPPISTFYHGYQVYGAQPEISGGACVLFILNILERFRMSQYSVDTFNSQHLLIEAMKFAFGHRMELGDPEFTAHLNSSLILDAMLDKNYAAMLRKLYLSMNATVQDYHNYLPKIDGRSVPLKASVPNQGTAHIAIVDSNRMAVSLTSTINMYFGSMVLGEKTGILFNDQMDDFSVPNRPNSYNLPPSEANFIAPGKRPLSSMAPTIIMEDNKFKMAVGASGGPFITSATAQVIVNVLDHGMKINEAINNPRFHHQLLPHELNYERSDTRTDLINKLKTAGHTLADKKNLGVSQGIVAIDDRTLHAASDRRKDSFAAAY